VRASIEFCLNLEPSGGDLLFGEVWIFFCKMQLEDCFVRALEPFILAR